MVFFVGPILTIHAFFFVGVKRTTHCSDHFLDPREKHPSSTSTGPRGLVDAKEVHEDLAPRPAWRFRKSIPHSEAEARPGDQSPGVLNPEGLFISSRSFPKDFEGPSNGRVNKPV